MSRSHCPNCTAALCGARLFCAGCGQKQIDYQRPFPRLIADLLRELLDLDGRMWVTTRTLLLRPGELTLEFMRERRASYTPPVRLYLVISSIFFLSLVVGGSTEVLSPALEHSGSDPTRLQDQYARLAFLMLPTFALLLKLVYRNVAFLTHLVFSLHIQLIGLIALALLLPFENLADAHWAGLVLQFIPFSYLLVYLWVAMLRVYQETALRTTLKYIAVLLLYLVAMGLGLRSIAVLSGA